MSAKKEYVAFRFIFPCPPQNKTYIPSAWLSIAKLTNIFQLYNLFFTFFLPTFNTPTYFLPNSNPQATFTEGNSHSHTSNLQSLQSD